MKSLWNSLILVIVCVALTSLAVRIRHREPVKMARLPDPIKIDLQVVPELTLPIKEDEVKEEVAKSYEPEFPPGAEPYLSTSRTQEIAVTNGRDRITPVAIVDAKWKISGGLEGVKGWTSQKLRYLPPNSKVTYWVGDINVLNSFGYTQANRGIRRSYPDGTEFHDVLRNAEGVVFEHRKRTKADGKWTAQVVYRDAEARPPGYVGLKVSCASCHDEAGTGKYGVGLVPGGDTIISDPLDWSAAGGRLWDWRR